MTPMSQIRAKFEARIPRLRLIDDTMAQIFFDNNIPCVETVLRTILDKPDLVVIDITLVQTQKVVHNYGGREVRLDVYAEDSTGKRYNIELQRTKAGASLRRARLNLSLMDARALEKGEDPDKLPDTFIIFITEEDFFKKGVTLWEAPRTYWLNGKVTDKRADDGSHIVYVNAEYADTDTSAIGKLMKDFMTADPAQIQNELLRERMTYFKLTEEGREKMCQVMEDLLKDEKRTYVQGLLKAGASKEVIMAGLHLTEEEFEELATPLAS